MTPEKDPEKKSLIASMDRLGMAVRGKLNPSEICRLIKTELGPVSDCESVLYIRYQKKSPALELLGCSDPKMNISSRCGLDDTSVSWFCDMLSDTMKEFDSLDSIPPFMQDIWRACKVKAMAVYVGAEREENKDFIVICKDGSAEEKEESESTPSEDENEVMDFFRSAAITLDSAQTMTELRAMKCHIESVFELAPVGIIMCNPSGTVISANRQAQAIFACGGPSFELSGINLISDDQFKKSGIADILGKALSGIEIEDDNIRFVSKSEKVCYLHIRLRPMPMIDGKNQVIGVIVDVTQRVRLQQQLERSYRVLTDAFQELQRMDKMKTKFIDVVSHELRTPLTVVRGYIELVEADAGDGLDPKIAKKIKTIKANTDRLYEIVESMLDVARIEQGAVEITKQETSVQGLIEDVVHSQRGLAKEKNQEISIDVEDALGYVVIDARKIKEVLKNILNNAIRYTPEGGIIQIGAADEGRMLHIWVRDNGIGIPLSDLEKIFDRFYIVAAKDLSHQVDRMGLGLPYAKGIVEAHGGKIWVESEPDRGSIFHINLPKD